MDTLSLMNQNPSTQSVLEKTRRPYFSFQWHITDQCDQRCEHCYIFSEHPNKELLSMPARQMKKTVEACEAFCERFGRRPWFYITGGDPLLHPDFWFLADLLKEKQIPFSILGNPFHLDPSVGKRLKEAGCVRYQMSLDGMEKTHDWFRKPGSFQETLEKIPMLNAAGLKSTIMMTLSRKNMNELLDVYETCGKYGCDLFAFGRYCPTSAEKSVGISPTEYRSFLDKVDQKVRALRKAGCPTRFAKKDHLWTLFDYEKGYFEIPEQTQEGIIYEGCHCGSSHLTILPNGDVYACRRVQNSKVGNLFEDRLEGLWLGPMEKYRDFSAFVRCKDCRLMGFCRGCPAVAAGSGSFYDADPQCWAVIEKQEKQPL